MTRARTPDPRTRAGSPPPRATTAPAAPQLPTRRAIPTPQPGERRRALVLAAMLLGWFAFLGYLVWTR